MDAFSYLSVMVSIVLGLGLTSPLFFGILAGALAWAMILEPVMGVRSFFVPFRITQVIGVLTLGSCAAWKHRRLHVAAVVVIVLLLVSVIALTRFRA